MYIEQQHKSIISHKINTISYPNPISHLVSSNSMSSKFNPKTPIKSQVQMENGYNLAHEVSIASPSCAPAVTSSSPILTSFSLPLPNALASPSKPLTSSAPTLRPSHTPSTPSFVSTPLLSRILLLWLSTYILRSLVSSSPSLPLDANAVVVRCGCRAARSFRKGGNWAVVKTVCVVSGVRDSGEVLDVVVGSACTPSA